MPEVATPLLRDIFFLWFYVTITRLKEIIHDPPLPVTTLIDDLKKMGNETIVMNADNQDTVAFFYQKILVNDGFAPVRAALASHKSIGGKWPLDPPHPTGNALKEVFIPPSN